MTFYSHNVCSGMKQISSQNKVNVAKKLNAITIRRKERKRKKKRKKIYIAKYTVERVRMASSKSVHEAGITRFYSSSHVKRPRDGCTLETLSKYL